MRSEKSRGTHRVNELSTRHYHLATYSTIPCKATKSPKTSERIPPPANQDPVNLSYKNSTFPFQLPETKQTKNTAL